VKKKNFSLEISRGKLILAGWRKKKERNDVLGYPSQLNNWKESWKLP